MLHSTTDILSGLSTNRREMVGLDPNSSDFVAISILNPKGVHTQIYFVANLWPNRWSIRLVEISLTQTDITTQ